MQALASHLNLVRQCGSPYCLKLRPPVTTGKPCNLIRVAVYRELFRRHINEKLRQDQL